MTVGNLEPKRDLTDVRDTVRAYVAMMAAATPGAPYNVCSGRALAIGDLVETFVARAGVARSRSCRIRRSSGPTIIPCSSAITRG